MLPFTSLGGHGATSFGRRSIATASPDHQALEARLKREYAELYPAVNPGQWYPVVQEGDYRDDLQGLWIRVTERVTYVLARHFDLREQAALN